MPDIKPGQHWLTVQLLGTGYAAVEMWLNNTDFPGEVFPEPWNTGFGRYATRAEAVAEARQWEESDGIVFIDN